MHVTNNLRAHNSSSRVDFTRPADAAGALTAVALYLRLFLKSEHLPCTCCCNLRSCASCLNLLLAETHTPWLCQLDQLDPRQDMAS
jgi:hypothetical protein